MDAVLAFIMKYGGPSAQKVNWPQWGFRIKGVPHVKLDDKSLENTPKGSKLWTFKGVADIKETDGVTNVLTTKKYSIVGNATVAYKANGGDQNELLPEVEDVTITKIKEYEKNVI